jgi:hypothetical protein
VLRVRAEPRNAAQFMTYITLELVRTPIR